MKYNIRGVSYNGHEFTDLPGLSDSHEEGYLCREREEGVYCQRLDGWSGEGRKGRIEISQGHRFEHQQEAVEVFHEANSGGTSTHPWWKEGTNHSQVDLHRAEGEA